MKRPIIRGLTVHSPYLTDPTREATFDTAGQQITTLVTAGVADVTVTIDDADLWWPVGQGAQSLYDLNVTCGAATATRRIGLRQIELAAEPDAAGRGFKIRVNGRDVFCKGANWVPADALPSRITPDKTSDLLQSAVDANKNMIRVWGGGRYKPTSFYDTYDELGLMVWQDVMLACNLYPSDLAFLAEVRAEVAQNVARLHACIALWCGENELVGALTWYEVSRQDRNAIDLLPGETAPLRFVPTDTSATPQFTLRDLQIATL